MDNLLFLYLCGTLIALGIGFLTGVFGVGGGFLMTPLLIIIGIPAPVAVGTSVATFTFNSAFAITQRKGSKTVDIKLALFFSIGTFLGVFTGSRLIELLKTLPNLIVFGKEQIAVQYILLCLFLLILAGLFIFMFWNVRRNKADENLPHTGFFCKLHFPPYAHFNTLDVSRLPLIPVIALGICIGILTGLLGIGGGVLLLPALIYLIGQRAAQAAGTSLMIIFISSFMAAILHTLNGNVNFILWIMMLAGGLTGTYIGTHIGLKATDNRLRHSFCYVLLAAVVFVAAKLFVCTFTGN